jgi:hypothetical protein
MFTGIRSSETWRFPHPSRGAALKRQKPHELRPLREDIEAPSPSGNEEMRRLKPEELNRRPLRGDADHRHGVPGARDHPRQNPMHQKRGV